MTFKRITATQILIQWSDSPKLVICDHDMDNDTSQAFDQWLSDIEIEENQGKADDEEEKDGPE